MTAIQISPDGSVDLTPPPPATTAVCLDAIMGHEIEVDLTQVFDVVSATPGSAWIGYHDHTCHRVAGTADQIRADILAACRSAIDSGAHDTLDEIGMLLTVIRLASPTHGDG